MAPSPSDITSAAWQPMDCRRSEVRSVLQAKTRSGNTAIRRQNVINWEIPSAKLTPVSGRFVKMIGGRFLNKNNLPSALPSLSLSLARSAHNSAAAVPPHHMHHAHTHFTLKSPTESATKTQITGRNCPPRLPPRLHHRRRPPSPPSSSRTRIPPGRPLVV
jgi:hypothetical protein